MPKQMQNRRNGRRTTNSRSAPTPKYGPVTTISTAPVAIGNSIRGSAPIVKQVADGMRVVGRDFGFSLSGTAATVTGWECIGGMPLTPSVLASSGLRAFTQSYANFKVNRIVVHYITSSPTSQAGDILFYFERSRLSPCPDFSNANFLPYVLSDPKTVIGPQWTNHSTLMTPVPDWKTTSYGMQDDIEEDAAGSIYLFSKTNAINSPGYIIIDYDITFRELSVNPRAGVLPISRGLFTQTSLGVTAAIVVAGTGAYALSNTQNGINGLAAPVITGLSPGDVFKCVVSATASTTLNTFTACTLANILRGSDSTTNLVIDDGCTFYAAYNAITNTFRIAPTLVDVETNSRAYLPGVTGTVTFSLCVNMSLVRSTGDQTQSSF